jgi:hypothetical protein
MCLSSTGAAGFDVLNLCQGLSMIRNLAVEDLSTRFLNTIPLPSDYILGLNDVDKTAVYHACLLLWAVTGSQVPREPQLRAFLALLNGHDCLFYAGTGSGKTLPLALLA